MHLNGEIHTDLPEDETLSCYGGLKMMLFVCMEQTLQRRDDYCARHDASPHANGPDRGFCPPLASNYSHNRSMPLALTDVPFHAMMPR